MEVVVNQASKIVEVWLPKGDVGSDLAKAKIDKLIKEYRPLKYRVVVFSSGAEDMMDLTKSLLIHNKHTLYGNAQPQIDIH